MKVKRIIILPVVIISVFLSTLCMSAYAGGDYEVIGGGNYVYYPLTDCISNYAPEYAHSYFYINYETTREDSGVIYHQPWTMFIPIRDNATYTNNNGIITVPREYLNSAYYYDFEYWTRLDGSFYSQDGPAFMLDGYSFSTDLVFNTGLNEISFNGMTLTNQIIYAEYDFDGHSFKSDSLNVRVEFSPELSGEVDRSITSGSNTAFMQTLLMTVENNCSYPIQYNMAIYKKNQTTHRSIVNGDPDNVFYDDDPVFSLYKNEWVYCNPYDTSVEFTSDNLLSKQNKGSNWHYVGASSIAQTVIKYSQMNLKQGETYIVKVNAIRCDYDYASEKFTSLSENDQIYTDLKMLDRDSIETVYESEFSFKQYDDVKYDASDTSGGVLPYDGYTNGRSQALGYTLSRNAEEKDGSVDYTHKDIYGDKNSWYHNQTNGGGGSTPSDYPAANTNYNSFLANLSSVYSFFGAILGYFPSEIYTVLNISLWSCLFIIIIRRLH